VTIAVWTPQTLPVEFDKRPEVREYLPFVEVIDARAALKRQLLALVFCGDTIERSIAKMQT
jgi:hypothetical protein